MHCKNALFNLKGNARKLPALKKLANERAKKASLHNRKLRDCKVHFDETHERHQDTTLFITEGDSASGSITKSRDVMTQAVFSLKGKPLNCFGLTKKVVYENEEFNLLQHALSIEDGLDALRYNNIVIATDADVDGMHIRLLLMTFSCSFFLTWLKQDMFSYYKRPCSGYAIKRKRSIVIAMKNAGTP